MVLLDEYDPNPPAEVFLHTFRRRLTLHRPHLMDNYGDFGRLGPLGVDFWACMWCVVDVTLIKSQMYVGMNPKGVSTPLEHITHNVMKTNLNGCHSLSDFRVFAQIAGPFQHTVELSWMDGRNELFRSSRITLKKSFPKFIKIRLAIDSRSWDIEMMSTTDLR